MIARLHGFCHRRRAFGEEAGQKDRTLNLRARNVGRVCNRVQSRPVNGERRVALDGIDSRAHPFERRDDASHRAARERLVADQRGRERMSGENAGHEPHRGTGIACIERGGR